MSPTIAASEMVVGFTDNTARPISSCTGILRGSVACGDRNTMVSRYVPEGSPVGFTETTTVSLGGAAPAIRDNVTQGCDLVAVQLIVPPPLLPTTSESMRGTVSPMFAES